MHFHIETTDDGEFRIIQTRPVLIGTFCEREVAERVVAFLIEDAMEEVDGNAPVPVPAPETEPAASPIAPPAPVEAPAPPPPQPSPPVQGGPAAWTEDQLAEAFERIAGGEKLTNVAASYRKSWTSLRGKWANRKRQQEPAPGDVEVELEDCRLCGKVFRPTPERMDLCKRCDGE